jgi:hypothetical protein
MGKPSRDKGARRELEIAELLGARKISGFRRPGPDLVMPDGRYVEVKSRKNGWVQLHKWLEDDASILCLKADRKGWLVVQRLEDWLDHEEDTDEG